MPEEKKPKTPHRIREQEDTEGGRAHPRKELSPDDFDIENDREKGEDHLRSRPRG